jgi:hypothetical protein
MPQAHAQLLGRQLNGQLELHRQLQQQQASKTYFLLLLMVQIGMAQLAVKTIQSEVIKCLLHEMQL